MENQENVRDSKFSMCETRIRENHQQLMYMKTNGYRIKHFSYKHEQHQQISDHIMQVFNNQMYVTSAC